MTSRILLAYFGIYIATSIAQSQESQRTVNGKPVSQTELDAIIKLAPQEVRPLISKNPEELLRYYGLVDRLAELAEKAKLAEESPLKEELVLARKQLLATAASERYFLDHPVSREDEQQYYSAHVDDYTHAAIKGLVVPVDGTTPIAAAEAKAAALAAELDSGKPFEAVAGKYPIKDLPAEISKGDAKIPQPIRAAVFGLKAGAHTAPIRLPNGVYMIRLESISMLPLTEVRGDVNQRLSNERFGAWLQDLRKTVTVGTSR